MFKYFLICCFFIIKYAHQRYFKELQQNLYLMNTTDRKKIEQTIAMLQQMLGQKSASGAVAKISIPGFDQQVSNFTKLGEQLEPELKELCNILNEAIGLMQSIINYSAACKPPTEQQKKALQDKFLAFSKRTQGIEKNPNFIPHAKTVRELISVTFWVLTNTPEFIIKGGIQAADFNAIKFQKNKVQTHNQWYKEVGKAFRILQGFVKTQFSMGLNYNSHGTASWNDLISGSSGQQQAQNTQPQPQQVQQQVAQKPQAPKVPKKELQGLNWYVANIKNEKITFNPGQIEMKHGIFIQNCIDCVIIIEDKFKSLQMSKSSNIVLSVNNCISGVQIMNGQNIQVYIKGQTPSISVDKCEKVKLILNQEHLGADIVSSKVTQLNIVYQKGGNQSKAFMVGEQLITKWNPTKNKFETAVYDKFM